MTSVPPEAATSHDTLRFAWSNAIAHHEAGRLHEAIDGYRAILDLDPDHLDSLINLGVACKATGKLQESARAYRAAILLAPQVSVSHYNLANVLMAADDTENAITEYREVIALQPDHVDARYNLANAFLKAGRLPDACMTLTDLAALTPEVADVQLKLGHTLLALNDPLNAENHLRKAVALAPSNADAHFHLGISLNAQNRAAEAMSWLEKTLEINPDHAQAHTYVAALLMRTGRSSEALPHFQAAVRIAPEIVEAQCGLAQVVGSLVPAWHVPMMNEETRNKAYFDALQAAINPDSVVLEIGTGSGLLAMMAGRLGARHVYTCEVVPLIAETAAGIVEDNGLSQTVTTIPKKSTELRLIEHLPARANLLVSEIFSADLLGEHVVPSIEDAKSRLLTPDATIVPAAGRIRIALFGGDDIGLNLRIDSASGFNLRRFNHIVARKQLIFRTDLQIDLLSPPADPFRFDFQNQSVFPAERKIVPLQVTKSGRCLGIVQWLFLELDSQIVFENHPNDITPVSNWQRLVFLFDAPIDVVAGQTVNIRAEHNRINPWFSLVN